MTGGDATLFSGPFGSLRRAASIENLPAYRPRPSHLWAAKAAEASAKEIAQLIEILLVIVVTSDHRAAGGRFLRLSRQDHHLNRAFRARSKRNHFRNLENHVRGRRLRRR